VKKILIFSLAYYPRFVGGAEVALKEITDRIDDVEFHMITLRFDPSFPKEEKIGNIFVHRIGRGVLGAQPGTSYGIRGQIDKMLFVPMAALTAMRLNKKLRFDGAWAMMTYMVLPLALMRFFGTKLPYALTLQDGDPFTHVFGRTSIKPVLPLLRSGFRNARVIQTISHFLAGWPRKVGYRGAVEVVPNGADIKRFASAAPGDVGRKKDEIVLCTASRLVHKNGLDSVIQALPLLPEHVVFAVFGSGPEEVPLRALTKKMHLESRVRFFGMIDNRNLPAYLHASDIFVRPSRSEGMGISFIEAFAAGRPVIATQEGGIADFLFDATRNPATPSTGWAVDVDSPQQIADAVIDIVGNPEKTLQVIENARRLAEAGYDWSTIARAMRNKVFEPLFR
jgi:glycosyltransferase involved in cell wall biosynthesis